MSEILTNLYIREDDSINIFLNREDDSLRPDDKTNNRHGYHYSSLQV